MSKKQSNPKPKNIKRPAPPPAPPRPYSDPVVEDMIDGLRELEEKVKQERKEQMDKDKKKLKKCSHLNSYVTTWEMFTVYYCPDCNKYISYEEHLPPINPKDHLRLMDSDKTPDIKDYLPQDKEDTKKKNEGRMINPKDYLRTVTEGTVKPDRSFIWTEDSMEKPKRPEGTLIKEWDEPKLKTRYFKEGIEQIKKVYCEDCKYLDHNPWIKINLCYKVTGYEDNSIHRTAIYVDLEVCNKNNDCQYYKEKWYKKLWRMFCK